MLVDNSPIKSNRPLFHFLSTRKIVWATFGLIGNVLKVFLLLLGYISINENDILKFWAGTVFDNPFWP